MFVNISLSFLFAVFFSLNIIFFISVVLSHRLIFWAHAAIIALPFVMAFIVFFAGWSNAPKATTATVITVQNCAEVDYHCSSAIVECNGYFDYSSITPGYYLQQLNYLYYCSHSRDA